MLCRIELLNLAKVLDEFPHVYVISDEIYERITYDKEHVSFAALPNQHQRTITINGFSKSHSMTGYRLGYCAAPGRTDCPIHVMIPISFLIVDIRGDHQGLQQDSVSDDFVRLIGESVCRRGRSLNGRRLLDEGESGRAQGQERLGLCSIVQDP